MLVTVTIHIYILLVLMRLIALITHLMLSMLGLRSIHAKAITGLWDGKEGNPIQFCCVCVET